MTTTTKTTTRKIPTPLYAAAGAGDLAYEQLRKLPAQVAQLRARVDQLRPAVAETNLRGDLERISVVARRNAAGFLNAAQTGAQVAQDRALAVYTGLVARGEKVVGTARGIEAKAEIEPAAKTATAKVTATSPAGAAAADAPAAAAAAKKTAPAKKTTTTTTTAAKK